MKKLLVLSLALLVLISISVLAQEKEMKMEKQEEMKADMGKGMQEMPDMTPPKPLSSDWYNWMAGEWEGYTQSHMGKSKDWLKIQYALGNQYMKMHYKGEMVEANEEKMKEWQEQMNLSDEQMEAMKNMKYEGMGLMTQDPKTGEGMGYWFDNWRSVSKGKGKMEGENKMTMVWEGAMGTETRTTEKIGENKMVVTFKSSGPMGEFEGKTELTRVMGVMPPEKPAQGSGTKAK